MAERGSWFYRVSGFLTRAMIRAWGDLELTGLQHVPPDGPLILASNHLSNADPIILGGIFPRPIVFMAKDDLHKIPGMRLVSAAYGSFTVRRGEADRNAIRQGLLILDRGGVLGLFPEGTRSRGGALQEAKAGTGLLALRSGAPVLPIGISGTSKLSPAVIVKRRAIQIRIGPPITTERVNGPLRGAAQAHTDRIMRAIAALLPESQRGRHGSDSSSAIVRTLDAAAS